MTFGELKAEVFRRLQEVAAAPVFWTEDDVETAINDAYAELSDATEWYERSFTISLLAHRPYYDLRRLLTREALSLTKAFNVQTNRWLIPSCVQDLDRGDTRWESTVGSPERFFLRGLWWLGYWPLSTAEGGEVTQYYAALPPDLARDTDVPGFALSQHYGLVEGALADLWIQDAEVTLASQAWAAYESYEAAVTATVAARAAIPLRRGHGARR